MKIARGAVAKVAPVRLEVSSAVPRFALTLARQVHAVNSLAQPASSKGAWLERTPVEEGVPRPRGWQMQGRRFPESSLERMHAVPPEGAEPLEDEDPFESVRLFALPKEPLAAVDKGDVGDVPVSEEGISESVRASPVPSSEAESKTVPEEAGFGSPPAPPAPEVQVHPTLVIGEPPAVVEGDSAQASESRVPELMDDRRLLDPSTGSAQRVRYGDDVRARTWARRQALEPRVPSRVAGLTVQRGGIVDRPASERVPETHASAFVRPVIRVGAGPGGVPASNGLPAGADGEHPSLTALAGSDPLSRRSLGEAPSPDSAQFSDPERAEIPLRSPAAFDSRPHPAADPPSEEDPRMPAEPIESTEQLLAADEELDSNGLADHGGDRRGEGSSGDSGERKDARAQNEDGNSRGDEGRPHDPSLLADELADRIGRLVGGRILRRVGGCASRSVLRFCGRSRGRTVSPRARGSPSAPDRRRRCGGCSHRHRVSVGVTAAGFDGIRYSRRSD